MSVLNSDYFLLKLYLYAILTIIHYFRLKNICKELVLNLFANQDKQMSLPFILKLMHIVHSTVLSHYKLGYSQTNSIHLVNYKSLFNSSASCIKLTCFSEAGFGWYLAAVTLVV